jgi:transposase
MAFDYIGADRNQQFLLPPSMMDWLPEDHLVWFVLDVVAVVDTAGFHARHANDGPGRPAWDPEVMLALLLYSYSVGMRSSRRIEVACRSDVAFRVICANLVPDHGTIARFRADHEVAIEAVFVDILRLCAGAGLASLGLIAIDGTKIGADAALDANRSGTAIRSEVARILAEAAVADTDGPVQPGLNGNLPENFSKRGSRRANLEAALKDVETREAALAAETAERDENAAAEAVQGRKVRGRKPNEPHARLARAETDIVAAKARVLRGGSRAVEGLASARKALHKARRAVADVAPPAPPTINVTDPESRMMKTATGFVQGYNAQAAVNANQIVIAAAVTQDGNDVHQLLPMIDNTITMAEAAGIDPDITLVLADAGYWSDTNATTKGPDRLIATLKDWKQRRAARDLGTTTGPPPPNASTIDAMEHRLRTPEGTIAYAKRSHTVEPIFGHHKENRGFRRFMRRGITATQSEWSFICATGNLQKLFTHANGRTLACTILARP